jgi:hypothetical protein
MSRGLRAICDQIDLVAMNELPQAPSLLRELQGMPATGCTGTGWLSGLQGLGIVYAWEVVAIGYERLQELKVSRSERQEIVVRLYARKIIMLTREEYLATFESRSPDRQLHFPDTQFIGRFTENDRGKMDYTQTRIDHDEEFGLVRTQLPRKSLDT